MSGGGGGGKRKDGEGEWDGNGDVDVEVGGVKILSIYIGIYLGFNRDVLEELWFVR